MFLLFNVLRPDLSPRPFAQAFRPGLLAHIPCPHALPAALEALPAALKACDSSARGAVDIGRWAAPASGDAHVHCQHATHRALLQVA